MKSVSSSCADLQTASIECSSLQSQLLTVSNEMESEFLEERGLTGWIAVFKIGPSWVNPHGFEKWLPGEPALDKFCAIMTRDTSFRAGWKAVDCNECHPVICKKGK